MNNSLSEVILDIIRNANKEKTTKLTELEKLLKKAEEERQGIDFSQQIEIIKHKMESASSELKKECKSNEEYLKQVSHKMNLISIFEKNNLLHLYGVAKRESYILNDCLEIMKDLIKSLRIELRKQYGIVDENLDDIVEDYFKKI